MDDVDRLYECFKCGVSPPESAIRERETRSSRLKRKSLRPEGSSLKGFQSPLSGGQCGQSIPASNPKLEKLGPVTDKEAEIDAKKQISPVVFYGSPHGVPPKRPSSLLRLLREIRIDLAEKHRSNLRKEIWATFPKQDEAMKFSRKHPNVHVFSYQDHFNGQRRFLVSSYNEFWQRYKNMDSKFRHHYEVIQEGLPCHLYFDLEFEWSENANKNGDQMVDLLISVVFDALHEKYCIQGDLDWIVELDSSTKVKFSRHLLLRIPQTAFKDNSHAGVFVNEICSRICNARKKDARVEQLFISKGSSTSGPSSQLFVDTAVYSRNRCFRIALSSKAGKTSVLLPTGRFKCKDMCEEKVFFASLICNIDNDCEKLLICKTDVDCVKTLHYDTEVQVNYEKIKQCSSLQQYRFDACPSDGSATYLTGKSPFPALDAFIISVSSIGNVSGKIRSWYWFSEYGLMVYSMLKNRFCERIGREHKSNHVMYVVDMQWALYYQKCYDPDCKGYRSPSRPIPLEVVPEAINSRQSEMNQKHTVNKSVETVTDSPCSESWWREAVRNADTVESIGGLLEDNYALDEDEEWWTEVEKTASASELSNLSLINAEDKIQS